MAGRRSKSRKEEVVLHGIGVSPGVVIGPSLLVISEPVLVAEREIPAAEVDAEVAKFESALIETRRQLMEILKGLEESRTAETDASILDAHLMVLDDRTFIEEVINQIRKNRRNVEFVVKEAADRYVEVLSGLGDPYLRERISDVRDVSRRIIRNVMGEFESIGDQLDSKHVIVAPELVPSETATLRKDTVIGFATDLGSPTSHTAVMARALEIPAVVGLHNISSKVSTGDEILIDGNKGVVILHPTEESLKAYGRVAEARQQIARGLSNLKNEPAQTKDGHRITLSANIETQDEIESVLHNGAEGVGLFRTEYLYLSMDRVVGEDEQTEIYREVASRLAPAPVIIRTLDIGGDKFLRDMDRGAEANPFLGCRSIRLSLLEPEQFKTQLRAILRASPDGNVKIMYPMVSSAGEVVRANEILEESKKELAERGIPFNKDIEVGAMIEIPSAALTADVIAEQVKFLSLGTNDLIQYTIAVDRGNERVAYLYEPTHPAVLKLIQNTIEAGHRRGIWVGVCGEMGADPMMTSLLIGLGVDELSVAPSAVPVVKDAVRNLSIEKSRELAKAAMQCRTAVEVLALCRKMLRETAPEILELI